MVNSNTCFKGANVHCRKIFTYKWFKCHGKYFRHIWFYIKQIMHACWQETSRDSGLGTPHMKGVGMLVVSLRGVNFRFCSHLGCHHIFWATPRSVSLVSFKISDEHPHPFHMRIPPRPGIQPGSQNPDPILDQKCHFSHWFSDLVVVTKRNITCLHNQKLCHHCWN